MVPDLTLTALPSLLYIVARFVLPAALVFLGALAMIVGFLYVNEPAFDGNRFHRALLGFGVIGTLVVAVAGAYPLLAPIGALMTLSLAQLIPRTRVRVTTPLRQALVVAGVLIGVAMSVTSLFAAVPPGRSFIGHVFRVAALGGPVIALVGLGGALGCERRPYGWILLAAVSFGTLSAVFVDFSSPPGGMGLVQFFLPLFGLCYAVVGVVPVLLGYVGTARPVEPSAQTPTVA